ncbi:DUF922 domain-containing protein [Lacinutrix sp. C3R15]|uniref:DUF922 domain-containing protein n=1 Tax=Flavobacteriaceae TaxID=49546 RepID=UPI001C09C41B|nr:MULTISPECIES: DUF922 domain-containing protein [Flavobacteriaceae]MBU2939514.1 DUF922 domain-containing protein [Lacinutrix sp. C3R15]MDO6622829.1 DUF922 domain-containing protein [Oceanihabitans sp. 1_MG-2023]
MFLRIFLICISILTFQQKELSINWSASNTLSWADFKAAAESDSKAVAITASGITFGYSIKKRNNDIVGFNTKIEAHFYPNKSWVKIKQADNHILAHEQFHFNITELFARKFRQRVAQLQVSQDVNVVLDKIHQEINQELANFQELYDTETDFSRNYELQSHWQNHIEIELAKLDKYKL